MSKEALVGAVKEIVTLARSGDAEGSFDGYKALFERPDFGGNRPEDQRQALKLLILAKRTGATVQAITEIAGEISRLATRRPPPTCSRRASPSSARATPAPTCAAAS